MPEILIVDDEYALADVLASILQMSGYHVRTAGNGREALARMSDAPVAAAVEPAAGGGPLLIEAATERAAVEVRAVAVRLVADEVRLVELPADRALVEILRGEVEREGAAARVAEVQARLAVDVAA